MFLYQVGYPGDVFDGHFEPFDERDRIPQPSCSFFCPNPPNRDNPLIRCGPTFDNFNICPQSSYVPNLSALALTGLEIYEMTVFKK